MASMNGSQEKKESKLKDIPCMICCRKDENDLLYGEKKGCVASNGKEIVAHTFCLLFSCGLLQKGQDDEGIDGFMPPDIMTEKKRGDKLKCFFCKKKGATAACCESKCQKSYHYTCAADAKTEQKVLFEFCDEFRSYCKNHTKIPGIRLRPEQTSGGKICCPTCGDRIRLTPATLSDPLYLIQCQCCNTFTHTTCVQKFARSAGLTHFKCTQCNCSQLSGGREEECKNNFVNLVRKRGVYIPDKDSDWELDNQFEDHLKEYSKCDAAKCLCPDGPEFDDKLKMKKWYIVICCKCAGSGCHRTCGNIKGSDVDKWVCDICTKFLGPAAPSDEDSESSSSSEPETSSPNDSRKRRAADHTSSSSPSPKRINISSSSSSNCITILSSDDD